MTKKIPTAEVERSKYVNYLHKAIEFREAMEYGMHVRNWNVASLTAIHLAFPPMMLFWFFITA
ncbi:MAG: hypothetical protein JXA66_08640 [Oligoflexia bacterium]|nr:hypothetical protein [Oligoflexia bacterium]